ncbi:hypothetical protein [uncultured Fibrella sp.]|uniref:hypothetical protein n=1 Tax=uncultured Fibrella sp. TaxID=1284596 RepID=UPI0035CBA2A7
MTSKLAVAQSTKKASKNSLDFVHALWKAKLDPFEDDYFDPYYDGLLYVFNLMHLSAKYQMITSQGK